MTAIVLWHIEVSHYNEKARWALDYKGLEYELRTPMPGLHRFTAMALTRAGHDRLPVLGLDGRRIGDSTAIIAALEESHPEPALYPDDPAEREHALAPEDYFDEELAPRIEPLDGSPAFDAQRTTTVSRVQIPRQGDRYPVWYDLRTPAFGPTRRSPTTTAARR